MKRELEAWEKARKQRADRSKRLRRARRKGTHTKLEWAKVLVETDGTCVRCSLWYEQDLEKDHIIPLYHDDSSDGIKNLQPICAKCNSKKGPERTNWLEIWRQNNGR